MVRPNFPSFASGNEMLSFTFGTAQYPTLGYHTSYSYSKISLIPQFLYSYFDLLFHFFENFLKFSSTFPQSSFKNEIIIRRIFLYLVKNIQN